MGFLHTPNQTMGEKSHQAGLYSADLIIPHLITNSIRLMRYTLNEQKSCQKGELCFAKCNIPHLEKQQIARGMGCTLKQQKSCQNVTFLTLNKCC
jgi:hypothetical protein